MARRRGRTGPVTVLSVGPRCLPSSVTLSQSSVRSYRVTYTLNSHAHSASARLAAGMPTDRNADLEYNGNADRLD